MASTEEQIAELSRRMDALDKVEDRLVTDRPPFYARLAELEKHTELGAAREQFAGLIGQLRTENEALGARVLELEQSNTELRQQIEQSNTQLGALEGQAMELAARVVANRRASDEQVASLHEGSRQAFAAFGTWVSTQLAALVMAPGALRADTAPFVPPGVSDTLTNAQSEADPEAQANLEAVRAERVAARAARVAESEGAEAETQAPPPVVVPEAKAPIVYSHLLNVDSESSEPAGAARELGPEPNPAEG